MSQTTGNLNASGFTFDILGFEKWPFVTLSYSFSKDEDKTNLNLHFDYDGSAYVSSAEKAVEDLTMFKNILYQLNWQYTTDEKPDEPVNVLQYFATCSITPAEKYNFSNDQTRGLIGFVSQIITSLEKVLSEPVGGESLFSTAMGINFPLDGELEPKDIFELDVSLHISRNNGDDKPAELYIKSILPLRITDFTERFENTFKADNNYLKLATGKSMINSNNAKQLWVVRIANTVDGPGIFYDIINESPVMLAPAPLSTTLFSGIVNIRSYVTRTGIDWLSEGQPVNLAGVDIHQWFQRLLSAIDEMLSPTQTQLIDTITKVSESDADKKLQPSDDLRNAKANLIAKMDNLLAPIINGQTGDMENAWQHLAGQLSTSLAYYGTVVQYKTVVSSSKTTGNFELAGSIISNANFDQANFSEAKINSQASGFTSFSVYAAQPCLQTYMPIDVSFKPSDLIFDYDADNKINLNFLTELPVKPLTANVPFILNGYPGASQISNQTCERTHPDSVDFSEVNFFDYNYQDNSRVSPQDILTTCIAINAENEIIVEPQQQSNELIDTLAQFENSYPTIKNELDTYLISVAADTKVDSREYLTVLNAWVTFTELVNKVAMALTVISNRNFDLNSNAAKTYSFQVRIAPVDPLTDNTLLMTVYSEKASLSNYPLPFVSVTGYKTIIHASSDEESNISRGYIFINDDEFPLLINDERPVFDIRISGFKGLQTLKLSNATYVTRNRYLLPNGDNGYQETNSRFVYQTTPSVARPIEPFLDWISNEFDLASLQTGKTSISSLFKLLFDNFSANAAETNYLLSSAFSYEYKPEGMDEMPWITLPIALMQDVDLNDENKNDVAERLESVVKTWQNVQRPPKSDSDRLHFDIKVFTSITPVKQLLNLPNIYLNLKSI